MASLFDAVERPQVIINTNDFDKPKEPAEDHAGNLQNLVDKLFGLHGQERYQLWPERLVRDAVSAPHDVMTGQIPTHEVDPVTGEVHTSSGMIKAAQDVSALAGTGGLAGAGNEAGIALGSGPILKSAATEIKPLYSAVENAVAAAKQPKADIQQWLSFLKNQPGVKQEEIAHLGLDKLSGAITKDELLKAVQEGQPQINEVIKGVKSWDDLSLQDRDKIAMKYGDHVGEIPSDAELKYWYEKNQIPNTKYHSYQLPGATNYREMLLTLPNKNKLAGLEKEYQSIAEEYLKTKQISSEKQKRWDELSSEIESIRKSGDFDTNAGNYRSSHWDEPNVLAHIRMNDRMIDGKKSLHLEEIQSDWHQAGRKQGYKDKLPDDPRPELKKVNDALNAMDERHPYDGEVGYQTYLRNLPEKERILHDKLQEDIKRLTPQVENYEKLLRGVDGRVPDAPFKKTWDELALKKAITHAVKNGYDSISWTPGEAQAARYDLSKQVDAIRANKNPDGTYQIGLKKPGHNMGRPTKEMESVPADKLADFVGKELAEKIIKDVVKPNEHGKEFIDNGKVYSGLDLKVGGQGMKAFYDKMLVDKMNALTKKYGGKVTQKEIPLDTKKPTDFKDFADWEKAKAEGRKQPIHILKITPELREHVLKKGFPLFSAGVPVFSPVDHDPFKKDK